MSALRVELASDGIASVDVVGPAPPPSDDKSLATITVLAPCGVRTTELTIDIDDAATSKSVRRTLNLGDVDGAARPRAAALAVAELLRASWAELALQDVPAPAAPVPEQLRRALAVRLTPPRSASTRSVEAREAPPPPRANAAPRANGAMVGALVDGRFFPSYASGLLGPRVELSLPIVRALPLRLRGDAGAAFGSAHDPIGDVDLTFVSAAVGVALSTEAGPMHAELGPKIEAGFADARGVPFDPTVQGASTSAAVVTAGALAEISTEIASNWWGVVAVDVGGTLAGLDARADGRRAAGFGGPMMALRIGLGYEL